MKLTERIRVGLIEELSGLESVARAMERVLSVQSHVVFGYVGGKAATFPLQCLGYDVDVVNTVHFSNHAGYGRGGGTKATAEELNALFDSLRENELMIPNRLLTGYIPGAEGLSAVAALAKKLKEQRPELIYLLDPVMGDAGRLYVSADVIPVYREMLPLSTIITPNWFEVETLTGVELKDIASLRQAFTILHEQYKVPNVVMSSIPLKSWLLEALPENLRPPPDAEYLLCMTSSTSSATTPSTVHAHCIPLIPGYFSGVGDMFSALLLGHYKPKSDALATEEQTPVSLAAAYAVAKTHHILRITHEYAQTLPEEEKQSTDDEKDKAEPLRKTRRMRGRELRLIQGQDALRGNGVYVTQLKHWTNFWG